MNRCLYLLALVMITSVLGGCALPPEKPLEVKFRRAVENAQLASRVEEETETPTTATGARGFERRGSGRFSAVPGAVSGGWVAKEGGDITLNFDAADLREVVKVLLGDILNANYIISDKVRGNLTLHTERPVDRSAILPILESALQVSGAAVVLSSGVYLIVPLAEAGGQGLSPQLDQIVPGASSFRLQVVPLRYVSAAALKPAIEPFLPAGASLFVNEAYNLFLVSGPGGALVDFMQTIRLFDVNWLAGMSFGLYPLERAEAEPLVDELREVFSLDGTGPLSGVIRLLPIERLNAVLVISRRAQYLDEVKRMIRNLDQGIGGAGRGLEVYYLQHADADVLAGVLTELYASDEAGGAPSPLTLDQPATESPETATASPDVEAAADSLVTRLTEPSRRAGNVQIIADEDNNALLVMATAADHRLIERAVRKLDIPRRQVMVEATIAEITLTDNLQYGLQWFLNGQLGEYGSETSLRLIDNNLPAAVVGGFSFSLTNRANAVKLLFDVLASESKLKILSSPQVLVIDNKTANIRVGDQVAVFTRSSQGATDDALTVSEIQYRDTGVLLQVTPQISAGGMVTLEISQEVSAPTAQLGAGGNPAILQRTISSSIAVQSGETVVLGGLIRENQDESLTGIPYLSKIPWLGNLFSRTVDNTTRTELVVTITPRVITDRSGARAAADELMQRMRSLDARFYGDEGAATAAPGTR